MPVKTKKKKIPKINLTSRKTRMIITVLVIAVIGTAFLVYQSFAATPTTGTWVNGEIVYTAKDKTIILGETPTNAPCAVKTAEFGNVISSNPGFNLRCGTAGAKGPYTNDAAYIIPKATELDNSLEVNLKYNICASIKGSGSINLKLDFKDVMGESPLTLETTLPVTTSKTFSRYCTTQGITPWAMGRLYGRVSVSKANSNIDVQNISVIKGYQDNIKNSWSYYQSSSEYGGQGQLSPKSGNATIVPSGSTDASSTAIRLAKAATLGAKYTGKVIPAKQAVMICIDAAFEGPVKSGEVFALSGTYSKEPGTGYSYLVKVPAGSPSGYKQYCTNPTKEEALYKSKERSASFALTSNFSAAVKVRGIYVWWVNP